MRLVARSPRCRGQPGPRGTISGVATFLVWVITALTAAAAMFAVAAVMSGRVDLMADMPADAVPPGLPQDRPVRARDVEAVRFDRALRGYRMDQVDAVLDRLAAELAARDEVAAPRVDPPGHV